MILVQRITQCCDVSSHSVDERFRFDYMGASEFERGILHASLKLMRSRPCEVVQVDRLWFVGDPANTAMAREFIESDGRTLHGQRFKERPRMADSNNIGWWWLSQDGWPASEDASEPTWCLFRAEAQAESWAECVRENGGVE